jgi:phosphoglycolate phosphatase-like HAD superfamily hydrolase
MTLVSTGGAGLRALDRACRKLLSIENAMNGIDPSGKTDPAIVREIFARFGTTHTFPPEIDIGTVLESYLSFLREEVELSEKYHVLPGITSILDEISAHPSALLGLATGNIELGARMKLQRGDLNRYFSFGGFGSDSENRTQLVTTGAEKAEKKYGNRISPEDIFVIGDTPLDIDAGRAAGYRTVGVATGRYSKNDLQNAGASFVISDFYEERDHFLEWVFSD